MGVFAVQTPVPSNAMRTSTSVSFVTLFACPTRPEDTACVSLAAIRWGDLAHRCSLSVVSLTSGRNAGHSCLPFGFGAFADDDGREMFGKIVSGDRSQVECKLEVWMNRGLEALLLKLNAS